MISSASFHQQGAAQKKKEKRKPSPRLSHNCFQVVPVNTTHTSASKCNPLRKSYAIHIS